MNCRRFVITGLLALSAMADASAASLAADSLLCDSATTLEYVNSRSELKGRPASEVIQRAQAGLTAFKSGGPALDTTGTVVRERSTPTGEDSIIAIASYCVASGAKAAAKIVEERATQGLVKVQTVYQGRRVERWTFGSSLSD